MWKQIFLTLIIITLIFVPDTFCSPDCKPSTSMDINLNSEYKLLVRSYNQPDINKSTYFRLKKTVGHMTDDVIIFSIEEAEFFSKFVKSPSETICILKGKPRDIHLSLKKNSSRQIIQVLQLYPRFSAISYIEAPVAVEIGSIIDLVVPKIKNCSASLVQRMLGNLQP